MEVAILVFFIYIIKFNVFFCGEATLKLCSLDVGRSLEKGHINIKKIL